MLAAPAANVEAELALEWTEPALEGAEHARGDARGMPIHPHHRAERLKPEWVREPAQEFVASVVMHDRLADHRSKPRHAVGEPFRHVTVMQRQIRASRSSGHCSGLMKPTIQTWRDGRDFAMFLFRSGRRKCQSAPLPGSGASGMRRRALWCRSHSTVNFRGTAAESSRTTRLAVAIEQRTTHLESTRSTRQKVCVAVSLRSCVTNA